MLCRSSTSCAIGVVLHLREKIYFIGKVSSTAPKGTKTVFSFRHPKPPLKLCFRLGNLKNVSRAHYIYNESVEKFHLIYKKSGADACETPETDVPLQPQTGRDAPQESSAKVCAPKGKSSLKDLHRQRM